MTANFFILTSLALACSFGTSLGQVYTPKKAQKSQKNHTEETQKKSSETDNKENSTPRAKEMFGSELPVMDPTTETITFAGHTWPIGDTRLLAARYEKYLCEPEDSSVDYKNYRQNLNAVLTALAPTTRKYKQPIDRLRAAIQYLPDMAAYPMDAEQSMALANAINTSYQFASSTKQKEKEIEDLENKSLTTARKADDLRKISDRSENLKGENEKKSKTVNVSSKAQEIAMTTKRMAEMQAEKQKLKAEIGIREVKGILQYQAMMMQFCLARRFEHAKMACYLYNYLFSKGDAELRLNKKSQASKLLSGTTGVPPTVFTVEALANDVIRDTYRARAAIDVLVESKNLTAAGKRLSEAYFIGEFLDPIRTLPLKTKQIIYQYTRKSYELISALDSRDFDRAEELIKELSQQSNDFNASRAKSIIKGAKQASNLHLLNAQQALLSKDAETYKTEIQAALEIWPQNPKIEEASKTLTMANEISQAKLEFQTLLKQENYRQIFNDRYRFAPAIKGDSELEDAFTQIVANTLKIEGALGQAREFEKQGLRYAAWEGLHKMREIKEFSTDPELGNELVRLSAKTSDLSSTIANAQEAEERNDTGSALAWYLRAQKIFPSSTYAKEGIERIANQIFDLVPPEVENKKEESINPDSSATTPPQNKAEGTSEDEN